MEPQGEVSAAAAAEANDSDEDISGWMQGLSGSGVQIKIERIDPLKWHGYNVGGLLKTYDGTVSEDVIKDEFGGGKFRIRALRKGIRGNMVFAGQKTIQIAGPPIPQEDAGEPDGAPIQAALNGEPPTLSARAMDMAKESSEAQRKRYEKLEDDLRANGQGSQAEALRLLQASHEGNIKLLQEILAKDNKAEIYAAAANQLEALRLRYESEHRQLRESHDAELRKAREKAEAQYEKLEDRHARDLDAVRASADREIVTIREGKATELSTVKEAQSVRIDALKMRIADLERALTEASTEVKALRAKHDISPEESAEKLVRMKTMLDTVFPSGKEEAEESIGERILSGVMESPLAQAFAERIAQGAAPRPPVPAQQRRPRQQAPDDLTAAPAPPPKPKKPAPQADSVEAAVIKAKAALDAIDPAHLKIGIDFLESAYEKDLKPSEVAQNARHFLPTPLLGFLKNFGVDPIIEGVVALRPDSPLGSHGGKSFARKVVAALVSG